MHVYGRTLNIIIKQVLGCSILLNAYDTPAERAVWLWNTSRVSEQERECTFMLKGNKKCKGHNTGGRDANH